MDLWVPCSTCELLPRGKCLPQSWRTQVAPAPPFPHHPWGQAGLDGSHSWLLSTVHRGGVLGGGHC